MLGFALGKLAQNTKERASGFATPVLRDSPSPDAGAGSGSVTSAAQEIKALAELRAQGILTDEEFEAAKREVLGR